MDDRRTVVPILQLLNCLLLNSEFLAHLQAMRCACHRSYARIKPKAVDLDEAELHLRMAAQKWLKCLPGNSFGAPNCHMGMKRPEIRFETHAQDRILNAGM